LREVISHDGGKEALLCMPYLDNRLTVLEFDHVLIILTETHLADNAAADLPGDHS
jgi:hypothetical protein